MTDMTWLESIDSHNFDAWTREMLIREAQRTHFVGSLSAEFEFLRGAIVDLGFEKLGLPDQQLRDVRLAFVGTGVAVPGTPCRLWNVRSCQSVVEPVDGSEGATLPTDWKQSVLVLGHNERYTWIGKLVRRDQLGGLDLSEYEDAGDGWLLRAEEPDLPIITSS